MKDIDVVLVSLSAVALFGAILMPSTPIQRTNQLPALIPPDCVRIGPAQCGASLACQTAPSNPVFWQCVDTAAGIILPGSPWVCFDPNGDDCYCCYIP